MVDQLESGIFGKDLAGAGFTLKLGRRPHDAVEHQDAPLAVQFLGDGLHRDTAGIEVIGADVGIASGLRHLIHEHEGNAGGFDAVDRRGAGLKFAGIEDDRVDLLRDEVLDLTELFLDVGLRVDHDQLHARLRLGVVDDGLGELRGVLGGQVARREADEDFAFLAGFGFLAAGEKGDREREGADGQKGRDGFARGKTHPRLLRTGLTSVEPNRTHDDDAFDDSLIIRRNTHQI